MMCVKTEISGLECLCTCSGAMVLTGKDYVAELQVNKSDEDPHQG